MNFIGVSGMVPDNRARILELLQTNGNGSCADCGMTLTLDTAWAVISYGIFVCDDCKLVHIEQENHCKAHDSSGVVENSATGIMPTSYYRRWEEKDFDQMKVNGNEKMNQKLLGNVPPWQYRPMAADGIKHKEYWIKYKYGKGSGASEDIPKTAKQSFIGIQFSRRMPKGLPSPCCAVLQNEKLYLTSDIKNEEIQIEDIETVLFNSKRTGKDNGVQLTYRSKATDEDDSGVTYTYLQHENMEAVLDWINLILYTKYNLLQDRYPMLSKDELAKILNCVMVKESYMSAASHGLIYVSLSEARIACFRHHLDEKPLFHLPISPALKFSGAQYLEALAHFFGMDGSKIHGYDDWNSSLEHALTLNKLAYLADDIIKPINKSLPVKTPESVADPVVPAKEKAEQPETVDESASVQTPEEQVIPRGPQSDKGEEKSSKKYECYPPIGPMGEMGKVARGELPPEAIKPPVAKLDTSRAQLFGMTNPLTSGVSTAPLSHSGLSMPNINTVNMNQQSSMTSNTDCYPPISGPVRDVAVPEVFQPMPRLTASDDVYPVIDEYKPMNAAFRNQERRVRAPMQYENDVGHFGRINSTNGVQSPTDMQAIQHYQLARSSSWNQTGRHVEWSLKQDQYMAQAIPKSVNYRGASHEQVIMDNLQQQWASAERRLLALIHNGYVPASNMTAAGLDANSLDHAQTCISELFDLLWKKRYDLALSFLRGFREVFSRSTHHEIRNQFIGVGELDTMKQIFLQQGREKFLKAGARGVAMWKQQNDVVDRNAWTGVSPGREPDYSPWGVTDMPTPVQSKLWGSAPATAPPLSSDPWCSVASVSSTVQSHINTNGNRPFNRAPSRPVSLTRSSFSETSPTEGVFDSKASSNSASPGVVTPPASLDAALPSPALTGIETTLRNLFLNTSSSGSTLWN